MRPAAAAILLTFASPALAQSAVEGAGESAIQNTAPPPPPCTAEAGFRAFDFWLGDWTVRDRQTGKKAGENRIEAVEGGCAVVERWSGVGGTTGMSLNLFNPVTGKWRQLWVSGGYSIDIEGGPRADGAMVMEGSIFYHGQAEPIPFRGTWSLNPDGSVRQYFQQYDPKTAGWTNWFDGLYTRIEHD